MEQKRKMNKLTEHHVQELMSVLDGAYLKLRVLSALSNDEHMKVLLPELSPYPDVMKAFKAHKEMETHYSRSLYKKTTGSGIEIRIEEDDGEETCESLAFELRQSARELSAALISVPAFVDKLNTTKQVGRPHPSKIFGDLFGELKDLSYQALTATIEEDQVNSEFLTDVQRRLVIATNESTQYQEQLRLLKQNHIQDVDQRQHQITKLKDILQDLNGVTQQEEKQLKQETTDRQKSEHSSFRATETEKKSEQQGLLTQLSAKTTENKRNEMSLRKKKLKTEKELENWIRKYDQEMSEKETEFLRLKAEYESEKQELEEMREQLENLMTEKDELLFDEKKNAEIQAKEHERMRSLNDSAYMIQRAWRGHVQRVKNAKKLKKGRKAKRAASPSKGRRPRSQSPRKKTRSPSPPRKSRSPPRKSRSPSPAKNSGKKKPIKKKGKKTKKKLTQVPSEANTSFVKDSSEENLFTPS